MRALALMAAIVSLAACETGGPARSSAPEPAKQSGVTVSGYARVGVGASN